MCLSDDGVIWLRSRLWVPASRDLRKEIMKEVHAASAKISIVLYMEATRRNRGLIAIHKAPSRRSPTTILMIRTVGLNNVSYDLIR